MADRGRRSSSHTSGSGTTRGSRKQESKPASQKQEAFEASNTNRAFIIVGFFIAFALLLIVRLVYLQVVAAADYAQDAVESRTVDIELTARRGTIYDRNGNVLACSVDATTIYAIPSEVEDPHGTAVILATLLNKKVEDLEPLLSDTSTSFCYIDRKEKTDVAQQVEDLDLPGLYFIEDSRREYPYGEVGGTIIGFVNVDGEGVSGLEAEYDSILSGVDGVQRMELGVNRVPITGGEQEYTPAVDGQDIMISVDIEMQAHLESVLKSWNENLKVETEAVLMDASTGEIYAAGSTPLLNPTDTSNIKTGATELAPISQGYEPGSIFKTVTAVAALEDKVADTEDEFDCPAELPADEYYVSDAHARGDITYTFREIIQYSSNVGISLIAEKLGFRRLYDRILEYGLNEATGVDYPGEAEGYLVDFDYWARIQGYNVSFGQGIAVTPIQMTRFYGAIVNNGTACTPHFLIAYPQTGEHPTYGTKKLIQSQETCDKMTSMLQSVVEKGTATPAQIDGFEPAGKTGTAEIADESGGYQAGVYNISFVGFLPNTNSKLVCFTGAMNEPSEGSTAGMFSDIMTFAIDRYNIVQE